MSSWFESKSRSHSTPHVRSWLREMRKLLYAYLGFEQLSLCNVVTLHASGWLDKLSTTVDNLVEAELKVPQPICKVSVSRLARAGKKEGDWGKSCLPAGREFLPVLAFPPPNFFFCFAKSATRKDFALAPALPCAGNDKKLPKMYNPILGLYHNRIYNTNKYEQVSLLKRLQRHYRTSENGAY